MEFFLIGKKTGKNDRFKSILMKPYLLVLLKILFCLYLDYSNTIRIIMVMVDCSMVFCGCEYYEGDANVIQTKVYLCIAFMLALITGALKLGS